MSKVAYRRIIDNGIIRTTLTINEEFELAEWRCNPSNSSIDYDNSLIEPTISSSFKPHRPFRNEDTIEIDTGVTIFSDSAIFTNLAQTITLIGSKVNELLGLTEEILE